jgi:glycosyltransferase involved in cell wall biosynthesis
VDIAIEALEACHRDDVELLVLSGSGTERSRDPRVHIFPYERVPGLEFQRRLCAIDALVLPFERSGMLTTGTVGEAIGQGLPAIASDWGFLTEVLGDAAICYGQTAEELTACIEALTSQQLEAAAHASRALRPRHDCRVIAHQTADLLEEVMDNPR